MKRASKPLQTKKGNENKQTKNQTKQKNERTRKEEKSHSFLRLKYFSLVDNTLA